jgi:Tol biopolymer transport system component
MVGPESIGEGGHGPDADPSTGASIRLMVLALALVALPSCTRDTTNTLAGSGRPAPTSSESSAPQGATADLDDLARRRISFMHEGGLYTATGDGSNRRLIARVPDAYAGAYWSPTARAFVIRVEREVGQGRFDGLVYRVDADGEIVNLSAKRERRTDAMVGWAPEGKRVVFTSRKEQDDVSQIYVMDADGTNVTRLTSGRDEAQYPAWSPDGERIAFTRVVDGVNFDIFVMDADGTNVRRLTRAPTAENWPTWSDDSSRIAFSREDEIRVMNADGSNQQLVTVPEEAAGGEPNWSPDGRWIAFDCSTEAPVICAIHPDGTGFTRLFGRAAFPFWMD